MASLARAQPSALLMPRVRFDLLAQQSIGSAALSETRPSTSTSSPPQPEASRAHPELSDSLEREHVKWEALPVVHPQSARSAVGSTEQRVCSRSAHRGAQTARIRFAPPPLPQTTRPPQPVKPRGSSSSSSAHPSALSRDSCDRSSNQYGSAANASVVHAVDDEAAYERMKALVQAKQATTARCFHVLSELAQQCESGSTQAMLHQIYTALHGAAYSTDLLSAGATCSGTEYFALLADAHSVLHQLDRDVSMLQSRLAMEQALGREFHEQLGQLDDDLAKLQLEHDASIEQIDVERAAVLELEHEYSRLLTHEQDAKHEVDVLTVQVEKQRVQLEEIQAKASYLDYISRAPMKKHLDEKKARDQEAALLSVAQQADEENVALEAELAALDAQVANIEQQYQRTFDAKVQLELAVKDAQDERERVQAACARTRECHTPRPMWDAIIEQTPELSHQKYEWDIADDVGDFESMASSEVRAFSDGDSDGDAVTDESEQQQQLVAREGGRTKQLVKEMLHWIERLQKHCGVNLHLSRIWHDIEEARVELNILHHQLDRAVRKHHRHPQLLSAKASLAAAKAKREYVVALGTHDEIPKFLRHQGKVKQRYLKKVEVETLVRKVWTEKRKREARNPHGTIPLDEVLYEKLHRKYGFQPLIAEWGYNILLALSAYIWDAEIELFLLCLTNAITDDVYLDQEHMLTSCQQLLYKLSASYGNESFVSERRVLLKDALVTLRKFFPLKTSAQLQAIEKAIIRDMHKMKRGGNDSILYIDDILAPNVSYPRGFFVKTIRTQHFKEIQDFYSLVTSELEQQDLAQSGHLPLSQIKEAIFQVDPLADANVVHAALLKGAAAKSRAQLKLNDVVDYKAALKRMNTTCLMKFTLNYDPNTEIHWQKQTIGASSSTATPSSSGASS